MPTKLKSFELSGYKTFATRTEFIFADKVTAIIGPNGSGKSNIADALRWVLGEQSYSLLRGKKTEDMIFSGSESRSRAGMASATILFDNSDNWLPIEFTEVAITRRAYRDGQNEYLLNGQRVRLRDVSELLAQSGLSERTYTVIGQGLVDTALSLKADERRRLFEEAAGTGLYRSRKEESLRRLEATHRNIERAQDILAELQPRQRSLERQAKRTNEYERVKADLHIHLLDWYGYHWHQTQNELARLKADLRNQEKLLAKARKTQEDLDQKITGFRDNIQGKRENLAEKYNDLSKCHSRKELIARELAVTNERIRSLKGGMQFTKDELSRYEEEELLIDIRIKDTERELVHLKTEYSNAEIEFEKTKLDLENYQSQQSNINERLEQLKSELTEYLTQKANLDARAARMIDLDGREEGILHDIHKSIEQLRNNIAGLEQEREEIIIASQEAATRRKNCEESLADHQLQTKDILAERDRFYKDLSATTIKHSRVQTQLEILEQAENTYQGYNEGTKLLLDKWKNKQLSGGKGSLANFLTIPAALDTAIAAVLGEYVDAFLMDDRDVSENALEILENRAVKGIILPVASIYPETPISNVQDILKLSREEVIGVASELVEVSDDLRKAVDLLLGQVVIVKARSTAKRIINNSSELQFTNLRIVTLSGEVYHLSGPIITGSTGQTILSRPRKKNELSKELSKHSNQLDVLNGSLAKLDDQILQLEVKQKQLMTDINDAQSSEIQLNQEIHQIDIEIEKIGNNLNWQIDQENQIKKDASQRNIDLNAYQKEILAVNQSIENIKSEIQAVEISMHEIPLGEQQAKYTFWNSRVAVIERGLSDQESLLSDLRISRDRSVDIQRSFIERLTQLSTELEEHEIKIVEFENEDDKVSTKISDLGELIKPTEEDVRSLEQDLLNLQKNDVETRQTLSTSEHNYAQARIAFSQTQDRLDRLQHRIEDDFGLVEYQYADDISGPTPLPLDGLVEKLPFLDELPLEIDDTIQRLRSQLRRIGPINPEAQNEYDQVSERINFLSDQLIDLQKAEIDIRNVIAELDSLMDREFRHTFERVAQEFKQIFTLLFGGGAARLELTEPDDMNETGIEITARLPGRREQGLSLLSGGERSLTASALIFALLKVSPPPFCVLDEVDAMLDEANVSRFSDMLKEMSRQTQFIVVTHNRGTIQAADVLYGVTMGRDSSSQVISLRMDEVTEEFGV